MFINNKKNTKKRIKAGRFGEKLSFASIEAYKLLRTNISFFFPDVTGGRIVGITSPCPQDGKSTTSINLAYALADEGHKVVLIDADMRHPSVYTSLELPISPGLSNVLSGDKDINIHNGILHENLSVITSGDLPPNPCELIGSHKMKELLDNLRNIYDYVIVDLPPVLAVSDPIVVSKYINGIIIVTRCGYTRRKDVVESVRQLKFVNAKIFGFVYNAAGVRRSLYYRRSKKYYYYK